MYATIIALKRYMRAIDRGTAFPDRVDEVLAADAEYTAGILFPSPR